MADTTRGKHTDSFFSGVLKQCARNHFPELIASAHFGQRRLYAIDQDGNNGKRVRQSRQFQRRDKAMVQNQFHGQRGVKVIVQGTL